MLLVVLLLVSKAGAVCVGGLHELRTDEVMVMCHLSEDVRKTRRTVVISHSRHNQSIPDIMLGCVWPERHAHNPDCRAHFHLTLVSLQKDCLMARVPRAQLHKDSFYQCQLVPASDADHAFSRCLVLDNDDTEDPTTTLSPVIPATDQPWPRNPMDKVLTDDHPGDNYVLVAGLTSAGVTLLVLIVVFVAFMILRHRRHRRTVSQTSETSLEKEQQPLMRTVPRTSETCLEKEQQPLMQNVQRASKISQDLKQKLRIIAKQREEIDRESAQQSRRTVSRTSETSLEKERQPLMSATPERRRTRERPSPKELTGEQPRREVPEPTNLTETKALLKMEQDKC